MSIVTGPKLGLLFNCNIAETYYDQFRSFLQALDQLIMGSVLSSSVNVPPTSPNPGDAYLLITGTPTGAWAGQSGNIAVWDTQVTNSGTNTLNPSWVFYVPNPGWIVWNTSAATLQVYNGTIWQSIGGGTIPVSGGGTGATTASVARANLGAAASAANSDITSLTGIPSTTINSSGYLNGVVNGTANGFQLGFNLSTGSGGTLLLSEPSSTTVIDADSVATTNATFSGSVAAASVSVTGTTTTNALTNKVSGNPISISCTGSSLTALNIVGGSSVTQGLLGFTSYYTQTTTGTAGSASALPSAPVGYLPIVINSTTYVIPYYKVS